MDTTTPANQAPREPQEKCLGAIKCIDRYLAMPYTVTMKNRFLDNWATQLRKGVLEFCILNAIQGTRPYGYDIVKKLRRLDGLVIAEGTIYPILSRFKRESLVRTTIKESPEGPPRKYYELTERGRTVLCEMSKRWDAVRRGIAALEET